MKASRLLHQEDKYRHILDLTSDTLILIDKEGTCVDIDPHTNLWFLQEEQLLDKNIFEILPEHTLLKIKPDIDRAFLEHRTIDRKFRLPLESGTYFAQCRFIPFEDMLLCRYEDITERENLQLKLEQTNEEMREMQEVAKIGKWSYEARINIIHYQGITLRDHFVESLDKSLEDYIKVIIPDDREKFEYWLQSSLKMFNEENITFRVNVGGETSYVNIKCTFRNICEDDSIILEGIMQNVTEIQKRRNDVNTLTHVVFNSKESIFGVEEDGTMKFANQVFRRNHHIGFDEDVSKYHILDFKLGFIKDEEMWNQRMNELSNKTEINYFDYDHPIPDRDDILAYQGSFYKVTEDSGLCSYWSFAHDISDQIRYESEIKRFSILIDSILNNLPASIVVKDVNNDFRYIYCNRNAMQKRFRLSNITNLVGKNDFDLMSKDVADSFREEDLHLISTGKPIHRTVEFVDRDGEKQYYDRTKVIISDNLFSPMILSIEWDITSNELLRRELIRAMRKAEESDKLKTMFLANVSHEIRTPLNAIVGFSNVLVGCEDKQERHSYYEIITSSTKRLMKLIDEILFLSRIESGDFHLTLSNVKFSYVCDEVYDIMKEVIPKNVSLILDKPDTDVRTDVDTIQLMRIYEMLISNAFNYTSEGTVHFGFLNKGDVVECYVTDNGRGLKADDKENVFGLFTKYNYGNGSSGLELTISHALVKLMGGEIMAETELGKGSKFTFTLPINPQPEEDTSTAGREEV
jgi:PAS domain S-box-containing protein